MSSLLPGLRSPLLPPVGVADLSDSPPREADPPKGWPGHVVPNFSEWLPGDIFLVRSDGSLKDTAIVAGQAASFNRATRDGSVFVHAGVYVGSGEVVDITTALGLVRRSIWPHCQTNSLALRRVPHLPPAERNAVAAAATALAANAQPYGWWSLTLSKLIPGTVPDPEDLYCSTLVGLAVGRGCTVQLHGQRRFRPLYPGTLAGHPALDVIELEWRPL